MGPLHMHKCQDRVILKNKRKIKWSKSCMRFLNNGCFHRNDFLRTCRSTRRNVRFFRAFIVSEPNFYQYLSSHMNIDSVKKNSYNFGLDLVNKLLLFSIYGPCECLPMFTNLIEKKTVVNECLLKRVVHALLS